MNTLSWVQGEGAPSRTQRWCYIPKDDSWTRTVGTWEVGSPCPDDTMMGDSCETTFLPSYKPVSKGEEEGKKLEENIFPQIYNVTEL